MKKAALIIAISLLIACPSLSLAIERGDMVISGAPVVTMIVGGEISEGPSSPEYADLFKTGRGAGLDGMIVINEYFRAGLGFSINVFRGDELDGNDVGKWWVSPVMFGAQWLPLGSDGAFPRPYLRVDGGGVFYSAVSVDEPGAEVDSTLFRTSTGYAADAGLGVEWLFSEHWGAFGEARYMITGHPMGSGDISIHDPDEVGLIPVRLGVIYAF